MADRRLENDYWKLRKDMSADGRKLSVQEFTDKCQEYIDFCINNPLKEVDYRGKDATEVVLPKMRAMTLYGLCNYIGIDFTTLQEWGKDKKYSNIVSRVKDLFYTQKFEGAAAGMLNPSIIARDLGLADKQEIKETKIRIKPKNKPNE